MPDVTASLYAISASGIITLVSLIGVFFAWKGFRKLFERNLPYFVSFSAGVFIMVVISLTNEIRGLGIKIETTLALILFGALIIHTITKLFPGSHHHEDPDCEHEHSHINVRNMFIGDAIHSFADGLLLAPAFLINPLLGVSASIGVGFHEIVQELSEFFVYKKSNFSTKKAISWCVMSSATMVPGTILGLFVSNNNFLLAPLLGIASGSFLYIIATDLIPESYHQAKTKSKYALHIASALFGVVLMWFIV